LLHRNAGISLR